STGRRWWTSSRPSARPHAPPHDAVVDGDLTARNRTSRLGTGDPSRVERPAQLIEQRRHRPSHRGLAERLVRAPVGRGVVSLKALEETTPLPGTSPRTHGRILRKGFSRRRVPCTTAPMTLRNKPSVRLTRV